MCGIAGIIGAGARNCGLLNAMAAVLAHRGPDDQGVWMDPEAGVGFAHRRLSIVDLTPHGHQPMHSADGRWVLCYNGEIYNHVEIRRELDERGHAPEGGWRGHSDTETLLQAIATVGLRPALDRAVGMFAIALWDRRERALHLIRDRFGEKPLYYGRVGNDFMFASELKAMRLHPRFDNSISREAVGGFVRRSYVPAPLSIYERIFKLEPGCMLTFSDDGAADGSVQRYWSYRHVVEQGLDRPIADEGEALEAVEAALLAAIAGQSVADVPVGAFLSGGIDSSLVAALYQTRADRPMRTFSIGFADAGYDEAPHARAVAGHLGTDHYEHYVDATEAREVIPQLPRIYDEPFADSSQIPTFLVSRFARGQVKVALSGDAGDELFGGYRRHFLAPAMWTKIGRVPRAMRGAVLGPVSRLPPALLARGAGMFGQYGGPQFGAQLRKGLAMGVGANSFDDLYAGLTDEWSGERAPAAAEGALAAPEPLTGPASDAARAMYADAVGYLPDDILSKVDRASMAVSLETRVPFLDHRVADVAARVPIDLKIRGGQGKWVLRSLLCRYVPRALVERPKAGFAIPIGEWLKGPLRPWAEDLLDPSRMAAEGWLNARIVQARWAEHLAGSRDSTAAIWAVLMFQAWCRHQSDSHHGAA